ncbi:MAG: hypothetical protein V1676_03805 [Candidatus Diapherotrites archaeon]
MHGMKRVHLPLTEEEYANIKALSASMSERLNERVGFADVVCRAVALLGAQENALHGVVKHKRGRPRKNGGNKTADFASKKPTAPSPCTENAGQVQQFGGENYGKETDKQG